MEVEIKSQMDKKRDCNPKSFHRVTNGKRKRKLIKSLVTKDGVILDNIESILEEIKHHFGKLFAKPLDGSWRIEGLDSSPILAKSVEWLDRLFSEEEIHNVVWQLNKEKAPRPDGSTITLYQVCWETIKDDLLKVFLEFHNNGIINQSINSTFIALVPKNSQTSRISNYRLINLVTSLYKIIAKVLSGQLCKVLQDTIFLTQGVFVEGKQIMDVVLIANELLDEKRRSREEGVVFKIDFEKVYDHID